MLIFVKHSLSLMSFNINILKIIQLSLLYYHLLSIIIRYFLSLILLDFNLYKLVIQSLFLYPFSYLVRYGSFKLFIEALLSTPLDYLSVTESFTVRYFCFIQVIVYLAAWFILQVLFSLFIAILETCLAECCLIIMIVQFSK